MNRPDNRWLALPLIATLILVSAPGVATPADQDDEKERRVVVDIHGNGPRVWSFLDGGYLGISMVDLTPELRAHFGVSRDAGVMISEVAAETPAAAAGLAVGDILTSVDGAAITGTRAVARSIGSKEGGQPVTLEVFRDSTFMTLEAIIEERERPQFWLNSLADGEHQGFEFHTGEGENVFFLPGPDSKRLELKRERLDEVMGTLHERLASPEFSSRMLEFHSNTEGLEDRIKELEDRLQELAEQLEKIED